MTFLDFQKAFTSFPVISTKEISIQFPAYNRNVLTKWQEKGYLTKIRNGYYRLTENKLKGEEDAFFMSNHIYTPSYVSLQSALRWYDFIPEGVFMVTSISTRKTNDFNSSYGSFSYRKISREFFWGYRMHAFGSFYFKIASPEKALLDFLYFNPHLQHVDDFEGLRLNQVEMSDKVDWVVFDKYLEAFSSKILSKRSTILKKYLHL